MHRSQLVYESVLRAEWSGCVFEKFRGMRGSLPAAQISKQQAAASTEGTATHWCDHSDRGDGRLCRSVATVPLSNAATSTDGSGSE